MLTLELLDNIQSGQSAAFSDVVEGSTVFHRAWGMSGRSAAIAERLFIAFVQRREVVR